MPKKDGSIKILSGNSVVTYVLLFILFVVFIDVSTFAKDYSYNDLGLDYNVKRYLYSTGKNGYKFVYFTSKNGSAISYKLANVKYDDL